MKITIEKALIENILIHSQPFLEKKDTSQITSHLFLSAIDNELTIKATDHEIGLLIKTPEANIEEVGTFTANGKKLLDIIRILKTGNITLYTQSNILHIEQGHSNFKLPMFKSSEFPDFPKLENLSSIEINSQILVESLKKITSAADTNNPKYELNGALLDIKSDSINFVATDTRRLALVTIENNSTQELSLIIPKKAIVEIQKLFFDNIEIIYDNTYLIIKSNQYTFFTKLINGKYPDYTRIIPKEIKHKLLLPKSEMTDAIKQITTISNDMKITFHNNTITFESLSDDNIEAKTDISFNTPFTEPFSIAVNSRYILDFIAQNSQQEFTIGLNQTNLPFILEGELFKTIVMPIVI
jgi:DNA polymerase-3 subunit beta